MRLSAVTLLVPDYDAAIAFYCDGLGFVLLEDTALTPVKRWVRIAPSATADTALLLARADGLSQAAAIGRQAGARVFLFLETDDFERDRARFEAAGAVFEEDARDEPYGRVAVFRDPFANRWDLIEPSRSGSHPPAA